MGLDDAFVELLEDFILQLWVLAKCKDKVLRGDAACLRSSKEEGQALVDDAQRAIFEVLINEQYGEEVSFTSELWLSFQVFTSLVDDFLNK